MVYILVIIKKFQYFWKHVTGNWFVMKNTNWTNNMSVISSNSSGVILSSSELYYGLRTCSILIFSLSIVNIRYKDLYWVIVLFFLQIIIMNRLVEALPNSSDISLWWVIVLLSTIKVFVMIVLSVDLFKIEFILLILTWHCYSNCQNV